jgi:ribosomal protein S18 acetylase RimI-like enzyme
VVEPLSSDIVTLAECMVLDADVFPYASVPFGLAVRDGAARVWVARGAPRGRVVGFLAAAARQRALRVHGLAVANDQRRRGIGRALLEEAASSSVAEGLEEVSLQVSTTNRAAIALYQRFGFAVRRRLRDFYAQGVYAGGRDAFEMVLPLE